MEARGDARKFCLETRWRDCWILLPFWGAYYLAVVTENGFSQLLLLMISIALTCGMIYALFHKIEIRDDQILVTKWGRVREQYSLKDITRLEFYPGRPGRYGRPSALNIYVGNEPVVRIPGNHKLCNPIFQYIRQRRPEVWISMSTEDGL